MMPRTPEPELMDEVEQVQAYAYADFEAPHAQFIELLGQRLGLDGDDHLVAALGVPELELDGHLGLALFLWAAVLPACRGQPTGPGSDATAWNAARVVCVPRSRA